LRSWCADLLVQGGEVDGEPVVDVEVPEGVAAFCSRELPRLVGALTLYTGDVSMAEELAQEALARACRDWGRVSTMAAPGAWVHRVGMNLAKSTFRRRSAARRAPPARHDAGDSTDALAVRRAVAALPAKKRTVVVLRFYLDYTHAEIAQATGMPEATVRSIVHRSTQDLRRSLTGLPPSNAQEVRHV
jgi:RNA polymerase sigma-70 factor, ECF subfamily